MTKPTCAKYIGTVSRGEKSAGGYGLARRQMMSLQIINSNSRLVRCLRFLARSLAIVSIWLIAIGFFAIAYIMGGRRWPSSFEILDFTSSFAVASAMAAVVAFMLAGRRSLAAEVTLAILILIVPPIGASYLIFWLVPTLGQELLQMRTIAFLSFRQAHLSAALEIARLTIPTATILGILMGAVAGIVLLLASRWPRLVGWLVAGLLLGCVVGSVHIDAFGRMTDFVVKTRLHGANRLEYAWFMTCELLSAMGATAGAVVGAVIACGAVRIGRDVKADLCVDQTSAER